MFLLLTHSALRDFNITDATDHVVVFHALTFTFYGEVKGLAISTRGEVPGNEAITGRVEK